MLKILILIIFCTYISADNITLKNLSNNYVSENYKGSINSTGESYYFQSNMKIEHIENKYYYVSISINADNGHHCEMAPGSNVGQALPVIMKYNQENNTMELFNKKRFEQCNLKLIIEKNSIKLLDEEEYCYEELYCGSRAHFNNETFYIK